MAHRGGALAIAVHSGIGDEHSFARIAPAQRPHLELRDAAQLLTLLEGQSPAQ
jgi:NagD protein